MSLSFLPQKTNKPFRVQPVIGLKAYGFSRRDLQLLKGSPFKYAMDIEAGYIFFAKPDKLLNRLLLWHNASEQVNSEDNQQHHALQDPSKKEL